MDENTIAHIRNAAAEITGAETYPDYKGRFWTEGFGYVINEDSCGGPVFLGAALALAYLEEIGQIACAHGALTDLEEFVGLPERQDSMGLGTIHY